VCVVRGGGGSRGDLRSILQWRHQTFPRVRATAPASKLPDDTGAVIDVVGLLDTHPVGEFRPDDIFRPM